jgi:hypothetical protein
MKSQTGRQNLALSLMLVLSLILVIAPRAEAAQYVYDEGNRLRWVEYGNGKVAEHVSDGEGNRTNTLISGTLPADVSVSSTRLDYGTKAVGSTTTKVLTIYNNGSSSLDLGILSLSDTTNYQIGNNNCSGQTIGALGSCTVEIIFHPAAASPGGIYLNVPSNKPTFSVLLGGEAVTTLPAKAIMIDNDAEYTNTSSVNLAISAPYPPNVTQMCLSNSSSCSNWVTYTTTASWTLSSGSANKYVYAQFRDGSGLVSNTYSDSIVLETGLPTGSILINGGAAYTTSAQVNLTMTASDSGSGVDQMRFSNDNTNWSAWEPFATTRSRTLTSGNGIKTVYVQYLDNAGNTSTVYSDTILLTYKQIADYEGDNKSDLSYWRPSDGYWHLKLSSDASESSTQLGQGCLNDVPVPGDYNGDGKTDIAVYRPSLGQWAIIPAGGSSYNVSWGSSTDIPVPGDYDGDGKIDVAVWRPGTGVWYVLRSSTGVGYSTRWGIPTDIPVPGDYDGDGKTDLAFYRPETGHWHILPSSTGTSYDTAFGNSTDILVPGDYDGDGKTDLATYRPSTGLWYIVPSSGGSSYSVSWGSSTDVPVPGDYDGDGRTDVAFWTPGDGYWHIKRSSDNGQVSTPWGQTDDVPLCLTPAPTTDIIVRNEILWQNASTGEVGAWVMNGLVPTGYQGIGSAPSGWIIGGAGDFTGDLKTDILWRNNSTGELGAWIMNGLLNTGYQAIGTVSLVWTVGGVGDFTGDLKTDILWQNTSTGEVGAWVMNGLVNTGYQNIGTVSSGWIIAGVGDFNDDGKPDILWQNASTGEVGVWIMNGLVPTGYQSIGTVSSGWIIGGVGDFNDDGKPDILWQNASTDEVGVWIMNGLVPTGYQGIGSAPSGWIIADAGNF